MRLLKRLKEFPQPKTVTNWKSLHFKYTQSNFIRLHLKNFIVES